MLSLETLLAYLSPDRREGKELPSKSVGVALLADLSGFTPLTESLVRIFGSRQGAEQLALYLNRFYDALVAPVDGYGGSVVSFSGDAVTCWFEADDGRRALAAARAMQAAMRPFASLKLSAGESLSVGVKIAIASGPVRRFKLGDPRIQLLDTLAGATLERLSAVGHLAATGEVLVDEPTETQLREIVQVSEWRTEREYRAAVINSLTATTEPAPKTSPLPDLNQEQLRPWLLPAVFARLQGGQGEFLTELRPAVALFMRFDGLDYDNDDQAGDKLDDVVRQVQRILVAYEGTLLQLTIGDKGSYLYAAFGAPVAHEDDAARAVSAALELLQLPAQVKTIHSVSIGLSRGVMRTGAYGSATRRTYGVLGDEVNLAARLMEHAAPNQALASEVVWQATPEFNWQAQAALAVKGKRAVVKPAVLLGRQEQATPNLRPALVMIGRQAELGLIEEKLSLARARHGQIVSITGEAGMGKSRLLAEVLQRATELTCYAGECQSYGTQSSYLVWHAIWRSFFGVDPTHTPAEQIETLEKALVRINPDFPLRLPLLGAALNLSIPDNGLTKGMDPRSRKSLRESLLVDCLRARAGERTLVLVLEDLHWIDPLSRDLLELIGRVIQELPVLILLAYRPSAESIPSLEYATEVRLSELTRSETEQLVAARLAQFESEGDPSTSSPYEDFAGQVPSALVERLSARTQGNPFYIEELLNYLHDRGLDPRLEEAWQQADLPDSLHSLILSRIDQLSEHQQITIKAASIIGRLFRVAWLYEYYPPLGGAAQVSTDLELLSRLEFTLLETPEPQLAYLFKHVITQEVAYESLAYATRASLHEQFASYLELAAGDDVQPYLDLLAYHYERSDNLPKKRRYLRQAGEAAQIAYANDAAISYLARALALAPETDYEERFELLSVREKVLDILGKREAQEQDLAALVALAEATGDNKLQAQAALSQSSYAMLKGEYPTAVTTAQRAVELAHDAGEDKLEGRGYILSAQTLIRQGNYADARARCEQALALAQQNQNTNLMAGSLNTLGSLEAYVEDYESSQTYLERALPLYREIGHRLNEAVVLYNLGMVAYSRSEFAKAQDYYDQSLQSYRAIGYRRYEGTSLGRIGNLIAMQRGDYRKARSYSEQALLIFDDIGDRQNQMTTLCSLYIINLAQNNYLAARLDAEQALRISREIGDKNNEAECLRELGTIADGLGEYTLALEYYHHGLAVVSEIDVESGEARFLTDLAVSFYHLEQYETAAENSQKMLTIAKETKNRLGQTCALILQGHVLRELGNVEGAADSYQQALNLALELGLAHYVKQAQTGLADLALVSGNLAKAQVLLDEILNYLETTHLSTIDEIFWIYLTCYRILQANADPRARSTLNAAHSLLQEIAARIDDETLRASFLQNVRFNREVVQAWENLLPS